MKDKTNEKLIKELLDIQQKFEALKSSHDIIVNEFDNAKEWSETLLSSLPYPAMYVRAKDRVIVAVNKVASDRGVKVWGYCWREFMKEEYLSSYDKKIAEKYPDAVPAEFGIKCSFCLSDKCFSDSHEQIDHEMHAFGLIWKTYWIKVSEEVYLHYAINITESKKAEEELILKTLIFESSITANSISNNEGIVTHCNSAFLKIWGYDSIDEVIGKPIPLFIKDEDVALKIIASINESGTWEGEYTGLKKDRTTFNAYGLATIVQNKKKEKIGYFSAVLDITERKQADLKRKESEEKLQIAYNYTRSLIEASLDPLVTINAEGKITDVNLATENATGLSRDSLIGTDFSDYFTEPEKTRIGYQKVFMDGNVIDYPLTIRHKSNKLIDVLYNASVYRNEQGEILGIFAAARDITKRKLAELALKENERKLLQLIIDKDRFISILGHDLKNPFNNILGFSEILTDEINGLNKDQIKDIAKNINKSAKITNTLLEDILMWARTQQGKIPFKPKNLSFAGIWKDTFEILKPNADVKHVTIEYSITDHLNVFADADMLKTVLRNLVSNAIKFTNSGGKITINAEQNSENVIISVSDSGIGIPTENLAKIFDISEVLSTKGTAGETGSGLGLLLCKEFVEKHHGKIWVESEAGKGSKISFTLPENSETKEINDVKNVMPSS